MVLRQQERSGRSAVSMDPVSRLDKVVRVIMDLIIRFAATALLPRDPAARFTLCLLATDPSEAQN